ALTMRECSRRGLRSLAIISQSFLNYPDPGAAASSLEALSKLTGIRIDTTPLLEKSDEIRMKARDLMRQAQASMKRMGKPLEKEMPLMYG
ncbi:MAG: PAC2 family protein, partial [Thaumarchaeota archaeon]|nr:PAC2 family protein [Nitrososphaerota archaeon]